MLVPRSEISSLCCSNFAPLQVGRKNVDSGGEWKGTNPTLHEDGKLALILNVDQLLRTGRRVANVQLEKTSVSTGQSTKRSTAAPQRKKNSSTAVRSSSSRKNISTCVLTFQCRSIIVVGSISISSYFQIDAIAFCRRLSSWSLPENISVVGTVHSSVIVTRTHGKISLQHVGLFTIVLLLLLLLALLGCFLGVVEMEAGEDRTNLHAGRSFLEIPFRLRRKEKERIARNRKSVVSVFLLSGWSWADVGAKPREGGELVWKVLFFSATNFAWRQKKVSPGESLHAGASPPS